MMMLDSRIAELIGHCRRIAELFDEHLPDTAIAPHGHRIGGVNPYYNRTESGLYLEFYYGYPSKIWTPGGRWSFTGSTVTHAGVDKDTLVTPFMAGLTTTLHTAMHQTSWGCYGPVYAIYAIDGRSIEPPGPVTHFVNDGYQDVKERWADLAAWDDPTVEEKP